MKNKLFKTFDITEYKSDTPGGKLADIEKKLDELSNRYDSIMVVAGSNDCDMSLPPSSPTVVDALQ